MSVRVSYSLYCNECSKQFSFINRNGSEEVYQETEEDLHTYARLAHWKCQMQVINGSLWDFCPKCWDYYSDDFK